jgi:anaerobic selenocysteine-containing dehydrogenase
MKPDDASQVSRRRFLKTAAAVGAAAAALGTIAFADEPPSAEPQKAAPSRKKKTVDEKAIPTFCAMCGPNAGCGIEAIVRNGKFVGVRGLKEASSRGQLCAKAHGAPQWVYSPQRLRTPLRRVGAKGEGKFESITWDEALDIIAAKLKEQKEKYGPESLAALSPAPRYYSALQSRFLLLHGSPNFGHSGICAIQRAFSYSYTIGGSPRPDVENTKLLIIWAKQPIFSGPPKGGTRQILDAKQRGVKIVAIKPSIEPDVAIADEWVPVRPGTDAALALGLLHVVIGENLYDHDFVEKWTYGFDRLVEHVKQYTPEWAERVTGVPAQQIRSLAREYATTKHACIATGNGFEHATSCNDALRAIAILSAVCGHLDRPGGDLLGGGRGGRGGDDADGGGGGGGERDSLRSRITPEFVDKLVGPEFPKPFQPVSGMTTSAYHRIIESVLTEDPYPVRTIIAPGTQPSVSNRGAKNVVAALKKLDFFVVIDVTRTAEMDYADIVIPVTTVYENDLRFGSVGNRTMLANKVIEPLGAYKSDLHFWIELAARMGYAKDFWNGSVDEYVNSQLKPFKLTLDELRQHPGGIVRENRRPVAAPVYEKYEKAFAAQSTRVSGGPFLPQGKVAIYNTTFEQHGYNPLPEWREPPESITGTPELLERYPLVFSDYHTSRVYFASWQRHVPYLREVAPDPTVHIHPETAKARGIDNGDWVIVESPHGYIKLKAEIYPGIRPDTVMALHGWWQKCDELKKPGFALTDGGANVNNMYSTDRKKAYDPLVTAMTSQTLVQVRKA